MKLLNAAFWSAFRLYLPIVMRGYRGKYDNGKWK